MGEYESELPEIQDSFFGMKMGSTQTRLTIERSVGYKGKYLDEEYISNGKVIILKTSLLPDRLGILPTFI